MPAADDKSKNKITRLCPECDSDVELTIDTDTGDRSGRCPKCRLDVGAVINRKRYAAALQKIDDDEKKAKKDDKKDSSWF